MPDEFEQIRNAMVRNGSQNLDAIKLFTQSAQDSIKMLLENQREILACIATIARGGNLPITIARDLQDRAKKITKMLEG